MTEENEQSGSEVVQKSLLKVPNMDSGEELESEEEDEGWVIICFIFNMYQQKTTTFYITDIRFT